MRIVSVTFDPVARQGSWLTAVSPAGILPMQSANPIRQDNRRPPPPTADHLSSSGASPDDPTASRRSVAKLGRAPHAPDLCCSPRLIDLPAAAAYPPSPRSHARCSGGEEARVLRVTKNGAQRASIHRSVRLAVLSVALAVAAVGRLIGRSGSGRRRGDEGRRHRRPGRFEHRELHLQRQEVRVAGPLLRGHRGRDLQPQRDVVPGQGGRPGRERPHLPRPRQRVPQPVRRLLRLLQGRVRASTRRPGNGNSNTKYCGEYYIRTSIKLAPNAVVILNRLCYASGNSEWGSRQPDQDDGQAARRQLRRGLPACRRAGRLRRGHHERVVRPVRDLPDEPHDGLDLHELTELQSAPTTSSSRRPGHPATGPGWIRTRPGATTARWSGT